MAVFFLRTGIVEKINLENLPNTTEELHEIVKTIHARLVHSEETI